MLRSPVIRIILAVVVIIAALGLLRYKPWQAGDRQPAENAQTPRDKLNVGFLPVT